MKNIFYLLSLCVVFSSCRTGYVPAAVNVPLFKEGGQTNLNLSTLYKVDLQGAYAIDSNWFIHGDFSSTLDETGGPSTEIASAFTAGAGYYHYFDDVMVFEGSLGYGLGRTEVAYSKFFVQPTFGWVKNHTEVAFTPKFTLVSYDDDDEFSQDLFVEPTATFRAGGDIVKFQTQVGLAVPVFYTSDIGFFPFNLSVGINIKFPRTAQQKAN
jgi:hypothetical protein